MQFLTALIALSLSPLFVVGKPVELEARAGRVLLFSEGRFQDPTTLVSSTQCSGLPEFSPFVTFNDISQDIGQGVYRGAGPLDGVLRQADCGTCIRLTNRSTGGYIKVAIVDKTTRNGPVVGPAALKHLGGDPESDAGFSVDVEGLFPDECGFLGGDA